MKNSSKKDDPSHLATVLQTEGLPIDMSLQVRGHRSLISIQIFFSSMQFWARLPG